MPPERKSALSALFQPTVPHPPQTILSLQTELSYFCHRRPLLLKTELRPFSLRNHVHPYLYPISRRGNTPERDCLDWTQYPPTPAVAAAIRQFAPPSPSPPSPSPPPTVPRARSRQPTPSRVQSRQPTPARQSTPGPSVTESSPPPVETPRRRLLHRAKGVRFLSEDPDDKDEPDHDDNAADQIATRLTPDEDGLISKPAGEVGRRKRGGYSLDVLGWTHTRYTTLKDLVKVYVENYLNHSLSASNQPAGHVTMLRELVS